MPYHVELFSCAVPLVNSKLQPPKPCNPSSFTASGIYDIPQSVNIIR